MLLKNTDKEKVIFDGKAGIGTRIFMKNIHPLAYSSIVLLLYVEQK